MAFALNLNFEKGNDTSKNFPKPKLGYCGGRYAYAKWIIARNGQRIPHRCFIEDVPDLQSTYLYNQDGSEALRHLMFDIDVKRTDEGWLDDFGAIDWDKVEQFLALEHPNLFQLIERVTRSYSGKGIHILVGIAALPLLDCTIQAQMLCRFIQNNIIRILNGIGLGADPGAIGLRRYFSTYRNSKNILYYNRFLENRIERSAKNIDGKRENFLSIIKDACDVSIEKLNLDIRLYNDLRLEVKLARLFLFCQGLYESEKQQIEPKISSGLSPGNYMKFPVNLTYEQIAQIMRTKKKHIYKSFWEQPEIRRIFLVEKTTDGIRISINADPHQVEALTKRALAIHDLKRNSLDVFLLEPEAVVDGMRNVAITSWALKLKWHGVTQEDAFKRLLELSKDIPEYLNSDSCRKSQIQSTVNSVYRHHKQKFGIKNFNELPEWLKPKWDDAFSQNEKLVVYTISASGTCVLGTGQLDEWGRLPIIESNVEFNSPYEDIEKNSLVQIDNSSYPLSPSRTDPDGGGKPPLTLIRGDHFRYENPFELDEFAQGTDLTVMGKEFRNTLLHLVSDHSYSKYRHNFNYKIQDNCDFPEKSKVDIVYNKYDSLADYSERLLWEFQKDQEKRRNRNLELGLSVEECCEVPF